MRRLRSGCLSDGHDGADALPERAHGGQDGARLVAAVRHAVVTAWILASAEILPVGGLEQFGVSLGVTVGQQVARTLPAEQRVRRNAPRRAREVPLALEEVKEQR